MNNQDREHFSMLVEALASAFGVSTSPGLVLGYWMGLKDLHLSDIEAAIDRAIRECKFMPKPVEIRSLAGQMSNAERAVIAWGAVSKAVSQYGSYTSVDFDDPIINATVRNLGGWTELGKKTIEEFEKWTRKDFERVYAALAHTGVSAEAAQPLLGLHAIENGANGYADAINPPKRVLTGLPPHASQVVREVSAPERLVLAGPSTGPEPANPYDVAARLAEQKAVS